MNSPAATDPLTFYVCTTASFLETPVPIYVENLKPFFRENEATTRWLQDTWLPEEAEHGRLLREYVEDTWPSFDWERGYSAFAERYLPQCDHSLLRPSPGLEALARCVTETAATMTYRCMATYTTDPKLQNLMRRMSADEVRHYRYFRRLHLDCNVSEQASLLARTRVLLGRSELVRDEDLAFAFGPINTSWKQAPTLPIWSYKEFRKATGAVMRQHFPFDDAKRMMFSPLRNGSRSSQVVAAVLAMLMTRHFLPDA
jgi:hypothetical protein